MQAGSIFSPEPELLHLHLQALAGDLEQLCRPRHVSVRHFQAPDDQVALHGLDLLLDDHLEGSGCGGVTGPGSGGELFRRDWPRPQRRRQVGGADHGALGEQDRPLEHVLELADVARPRVSGEGGQRVVLDPLDVLLQASVVLLPEMLHQQRNVVPPLAQRRQVDGDDVQPIVEVLAEPSRRDLPSQVPRGGCDQAHHDARRLHSSHPLELALLDGAEQLDLHLDGDLADLIEEEGAAVGELEAAGFALDRSGEGALLETEQLGLDQLAGNGGAVDLDERAVAAVGLLVQRGSDQLFSGAALALDQDRGGRIGDLEDDLLQLEHPLSLADDLGKAAPRLVGDDVAGVEIGLAGGLGNDRLQLRVLEGLGDEVEGAGLHRLYRAVHPAVGRHHDHGYVGVGDDHLAEQREAVHLRHHQIGDHDVGAVAVERRQRLLAVGCDLHLISLTLERGREDLPEALFIVDDEHAVCHLRWGLSRPLEAWQTNRNARAARQLVRTGRIGGPVTRLATLLLAAGASLAACSSSPNCETCASLGNACVPPGACTPSSCERSIVTSALPAAQVQSLGVHKVGTELTFAVPSGAGSVTIVQQAKIAGLTVVYKNQVIDNSAVPLTVTFPDGRIAYDDNVDAGNPSPDGGEDSSGSYAHYGGVTPNTAAFTIPNTAASLDGGVPAGTWKFVVNDYAYECTLVSGCGGMVVGVGGTIPGPASFNGTVQSGAVVSIADLFSGLASCPTGAYDIGACGPDEVAFISAHETGHFLGLFHTTEREGADFDPLTDTPKCPCTSCAAPGSRCGTYGTNAPTLLADRCASAPTCGGGDNLMFWFLEPGVSAGTLTSQQSQVMRLNPLMHQ